MFKILRKNGFEYLAYGLILMLFFSKAIPNIILVILSLWAIIDFKSIKKTKFEFSATIFLVVLLVFLSFKSIIFGTINYDLKVYKGVLLALWLMFVFKKIKNTERLKAVILLSINLVILSSLCLISLYYLKNKNLPFSNTAEVNQLLLLERPYMGFIAVLGFLLSLQRAINKSNWSKLYIFNSTVLLGFILLISARISIISVFAIAVIYFVFYLKSKWYKKIIYALVLLLLFVAIVMSNKNIGERFFIKNNFEKSLQVASDYEPRFVIWNCAFKMTKQNDFNLFTGFEGYKVINSHFLDCYASSIENESKKEYFLTEKFNSHNQFIDFYLIGGIIAFLLFASFFVMLFLQARLDFFKMAIVVSFLLFFIVENIFYRQFGCYLFGIFILILLHRKTNEEN